MGRGGSRKRSYNLFYVEIKDSEMRKIWVIFLFARLHKIVCPLNEYCHGHSNAELRFLPLSVISIKRYLC
jgi:hypothetical protein